MIIEYMPIQESSQPSMKAGISTLFSYGKAGLKSPQSGLEAGELGSIGVPEWAFSILKS